MENGKIKTGDIVVFTDEALIKILGASGVDKKEHKVKIVRRNDDIEIAWFDDGNASNVYWLNKLGVF